MTHGQQGAGAGQGGPEPATGIRYGTPDEVAHGHADAVAPSGSGDIDPTCAVAHGAEEPAAGPRTLVAVFDSPVARHLLRYGSDTGFRVVLLEPDEQKAAAAVVPEAEVATSLTVIDPAADVVVTDHHRPELDTIVRDLLSGKARWIGVMGNPRQPAPYLPGLRAFGVPEDDLARVHRPIGLNIGSRTPAEIAISVLAGLIADRNGRQGGFDF